MARNWLIVFGFISLLQPACLCAQHHHGDSGSERHGFGRHGHAWVVNPGFGYSGYIGSGVISYSTQPIQYFPYLPAAAFYATDSMPAITDPAKAPIVPSAPAARMRSLEYQMRGDQRMRQQKWSDARVAYRSAVDAAPDRAETHLRLGLCLVAIQQFEPAIRQFKRALFIDPKLPAATKISQNIHGPDSQIVRMSIISKLSDWVREDYRDPDRLFLLGVILHYEGDARAPEVFEAAMRMKRKGDASHIALFMDPNAKPVPGFLNAFNVENPNLNQLPVPLDIKPVDIAGPVPKAPARTFSRPIVGAPVPMPDL